MKNILMEEKMGSPNPGLSNNPARAQDTSL